MTNFTKESFIAAKQRSEEIVENYNLLRNEEDAMNNRAYAQARQIVRKMIAEQSGSEYALLSPSGKADVNKVADAKVTAIKKVATQIIGKIKAKKPSTRLGSFVAGSKLDNEGAEEHGEFKESLNRLFSEKFKATANDDMDDKGKKKEPLIDPKSKKPNAITYFNKFGESVSNALLNKSNKSGISFNILGEVYCRGLETWNESVNISQQQYAFARVNSYINQGKTYFKEDADLHLDDHPNCGTPDCCGQCNDEVEELDEQVKVTIKKQTSDHPNVSQRDVTYDVYHDGKYHKTFKDINDALDHKEKVEGLNENAWNQLGQTKPVGGTLPAPKRGSVPKHGQKFSGGDLVVAHSGPHAGEVHKVTSSRAGGVTMVNPNGHKYDSVTVRAKHEHVSPANDAQKAKYHADAKAFSDRVKALGEEAEQVDEFVSKEDKKKLAGKIEMLRAQDIPPKTLHRIASKVYKRADSKLKQEAALTEPQSKDPIKPSSRFRGTDSLTKIYKKDTPGQALNNSFEATFNENVKSALKEPVIMPAIRKADGTYTPARVEWKKTNKKIIASGNVSDGEPSV
jgi:hypothetical protein